MLDAQPMKKGRILNMFNAIKRFFIKIGKCFSTFGLWVKNVFQSSKNDLNARKRYVFLTVSFLLFVNYLMICFHIDKNVFDFFPTIPIQESYHKINIFIPDLDGTILEEARNVVEYSSNERLALFIFNEVMKGSHFENTSIMVPTKLIVRTIWIEDSKKICIFDLEPVILSDDVNVIQGSEKLFLDALTRSIKANIPGITDVKLLERGIPSRIWEM